MVSKVDTISDIKGIGDATIKKLFDSGFDSFEACAYSSPALIRERSGVGEETANKVYEVSFKKLQLGAFKSGLDVDKAIEEERKCITTGVKSFDELLGGRGIRSGELTGASGKYSAGKCVSKNTPVLVKKNQTVGLKSIESLYKELNTSSPIGIEGYNSNVFKAKKGTKVFSFNDGEITNEKIVGVYREKVNSILNVVIDGGKEVKITSSHPMLVCENGIISWKKNVSEGDYIGTPLIKSEFSNDNNQIDLAWITGLWVAEGDKQFIHNCNLLIQAKAERIYKSLGFGHLKFIKIKNSVGKQRITFPTKLRNMMGINESFYGSANKKVPPLIFSSNKNSIISFLAGYFDGDGYKASYSKEYEMGNKESVSKSEKLIDDIVYLFAMCGIGSYKRPRVLKSGKYKGNKYYCVGTRFSQYNSQFLKLFNNFSVRHKAKASNVNRCAANIPYTSNLKSELRECSRIVSFDFNFSRRNNTTTNLFLNNVQCTSIPQLENAVSYFCERLLAFDNIKSVLEDNIISETDIISVIKRIGKINPKRIIHYRRYIDRKGPRNLELTKKELLSFLDNYERNKITKVSNLISKLTKLIKISQCVEWRKIKSVKKLPYNDFVYDLIIDKTHNFIGGKQPIFLHNSQLGFQFAVNAQLPIDLGGLGKNTKVVFIDTEATFSTKRIKQMALAKDLDPKKVLKNLMYVQTYSAQHQIRMNEEIIKSFGKDTGKDIGLVIVDSLMANFRSDYIGRGQLAERQGLLNKYIHSLLRISFIKNIPVYVTNQVMDRPNVMYGDPTIMIGGNIVSHAFNPNIFLRKMKLDYRKALIKDSSELPDSECVFRVTENGLID